MFVALLILKVSGTPLECTLPVCGFAAMLPKRGCRAPELLRGRQAFFQGFSYRTQILIDLRQATGAHRGVCQPPQILNRHQPPFQVPAPQMKS